MRCNIMMTGFVKKNLKNAHKVLVERLLKKVEFVEEVHYQQSMSSGSVRNSIVSPPTTPSTQHSQPYLPQRSDGSVIDDMYKYGGNQPSLHPAMQQQQYSHYSPHDDPSRSPNPPPHYWQNPDQKRDWNMAPPWQRNSYVSQDARPHSFAAELPGSDPRMPAELHSPRTSVRSSANFSAGSQMPQEKEVVSDYRVPGQ